VSLVVESALSLLLTGGKGVGGTQQQVGEVQQQ
jgi:hypothetical protein